VGIEAFAQGAPYEEVVIDVGNLGLTVTNAGFIGQSNIRNNPAGPPSFEYPLDSGVEHLFEAGLWIGAIRGDGVTAVRTGAQTASGGYRPGAAGYEMAQLTPIVERSTLPESEAFSGGATSHQDYLTSFVDTAAVLPGTSIPTPDVSGQIGALVLQQSYAWNFPFTEYFVIVNFDIVNIGPAGWDNVYVGLFHDLVVRNVGTTTENGSAFFNKNGIGYLEHQLASYAFNAGGTEESINTYGAVVFLGAEWTDTRTGLRRFFHPNVADDYVHDGYAPPVYNPRFWLFSGGINEFAVPVADVDKYRFMAEPYPNPAAFPNPAEYESALDDWRERLRTDGQTSNGNWIGLSTIGPFAGVAPGDTLQATFAFVAALKPEEFQGQGGKPIDNETSRTFLVNNILWAQRTYAGEDNNLDGRLDPAEDANGNGVLDRYRIPEPPVSPRLRVAFEAVENPSDERQANRTVLYWDRRAEDSIDPVTGLKDFEGYRLYRSNPGDDLSGDILNRATLIAQHDRPGNRTGFNNGFEAVRLDAPVTFEGDPTEYWYRFESNRLLSGWQYLFTLTAFDEGDPDAGLESFESSRTANAIRVFPGTPPADGDRKVGVYPNPYRVNAAWDGGTSRTRKLNFYNLPRRAEIRIYTLAGEVVATLDHDVATYSGDTRWYANLSADNRIQPGGEHSWDILSENGLNIAAGLYLFSVRNLDSGETHQGKFAIIK
jgi:hypothetical protein